MSYVTRLVNNPYERLIQPTMFKVDHNFFSPVDVQNVLNYCGTLPLNDGPLFSNATDYSERKAKINLTSGVNDSNRWIYEKFNNLIGYYNDNYFGFELTGFDYMQYAEYEDGGHQNFHMDINWNFDPVYFSECFRKLTVVLLLSEPNVEFAGGQFLLNTWTESKPIVPEMHKGSVLMFPSFLIHKVAPVLSGVRKSLVVWVVGPKFK